ncbi:tetratricopeptide repeat protein [Actinomadura kijaniata]|uniref:tetratricopeptide repeat protein n=1 Tax=Actinomadura kijaniata TaxID=46161 RepID=UPI003F1BF0C7
MTAKKASTRTSGRRRNTALAALLAETGWTNGQFARAVNQVGREVGWSLRYDDSAVCHWLSGTRPRAPVRPLVCEALTRRLGRPVTVQAAGWGSDQAASAPIAHSGTLDIVAGLLDLGSADMDPSRRTVLGAIGLYSAALALPQWNEIKGRWEKLRTDPHTRIGSAEVASVRAMTEHLSRLDDQVGGRTVRPMAAAFLVNTIVPYLRAEASHSVRRQMLSAAADHCYLTGYMAMDERADGLAQRYYRKALELAGYAGDHLTYCTTLRGMSVQAVDLRHSSDALHLADAAAQAAPQAGPRMLAFLVGQQAHAAAQWGDRDTAIKHLQRAEAAMDRAESQTTTFGSYDSAALAYHSSQVRYELGDRAASIAALEQADRQRHSIYRRIRVRHLGTVAERKLELGRLEEACRDWHRMLDDYPDVQSGRCDDRFQTMMALLGRYRRNAHAKALHERARDLTRSRGRTRWR